MERAEKHRVIRELTATDCPFIVAAFARQGWDKPLTQFVAYYHESLAGSRVVLVAEVDGVFAGYLTIVWESHYPPFRADGIPEVVDFNVLIAARRQGIGSALLDEAERRIAQRSPVAGIGVGLTAEYGAAHILYARRGYIPDGLGLFQAGRHLRYGDHAVVDDDLVLYMTRRLLTHEP